MIGVDFRIEGVEHTQRALMTKYKSKLSEYVKWLRARMQMFLDEIKNEIPYGKTGKTRESIYIVEMDWGDKGVFYLVTDSMVVLYLEYGTKAHGPVTAKALHWVDNGQDIFARWVRGIDANPVIQRATGALMADLTAAWEA